MSTSSSADPSEHFSVELGHVIRSARELIAECVEEGIDEFERIPAEALLPATDANQAEPAGATAKPVPHPAQSRTTEAQPPSPGATSSPSPPQWKTRPSLEEVRELLGECTRCGLCEGRKSIVFGSGNAEADLMFIGEGPGQQEDEQGLPFVGRAGELLTNMIEKGLGISREEVYICNIVKCRPPKNRNPLPAEVAACQPFLDGQIDAVRPKVIVSLGKPAASLLLGRDVAITRIRGTWHSYRGIPLMPTLHPAFILRQYTAENRRSVWEDLKAALAKARAEA